MKNKNIKKTKKNKKSKIKFTDLKNFYQEQDSKKFAQNQSTLSEEDIGYNPFLNFSIKSSTSRKN